MKKILIFSNDPIETYYEKGEIKSRYFNPGDFFDEVHIVSFCDKEIEEEKVQEIAGKAKLKIYPVGKILSLKQFWNFFKIRRQILELVRSINPTIIRAFNPLIEGSFGIYCGRKLDIPVVVSLHSDYEELRNLTLKYFRFLNKSNYRILRNHLLFCILSKLTEKYCLSNASETICVSRFLLRYAKKYGAKNISVIYNKVDTNQFVPRENRGEKKKLTILSVGRIGVQKNQECLIKSIKDLDVSLILIGGPDLGDDGYYENLQRLVKKMNIEERVEFVKSVPNSEIAHYYSRVDIFAIASRCEGFCIPILEAMASGLPVVANNKEPLSEILGGTGMVIENKPEAFKAAFQELISNPQLRKELGEKAKKRAIELDGEIMEKKEVELYRKLLENNHKNVWNKIYEKYKGPDAINRQIYAQITKVLEKYISPGDSILEVGCGSGYMVSYFQDKTHYSVGLDIHDEPLRVAREVFKVKNLIRGDMFNLPFKDFSFDIVWNEGVLEHFKISRAVEAVKEMKRVSRKYVIIDVPNRFSVWVIRKHLLKLIGKWSYGYEESYSPKRLEHLMEKAGLKVVGFYGVHLSPPMSIWGKWKLLPLLFLELPLPEKMIFKFLKSFSAIEDKHPKLVKLFGFHLIAVGKVE